MGKAFTVIICLISSFLCFQFVVSNVWFGWNAKISIENTNVSYSVLIATQNKIKDKIDECSWSHSANITKYLYKTYQNEYDRYIIGLKLLLSKSNLVFALKSGSLLGAVRHGGAIQGDNDLDIIIPVWMNLNVFNHSNISYNNCPIAKQMYEQTIRKKRKLLNFETPYIIAGKGESFHITPYLKRININKKDNMLCGLDWLEWVVIVAEYFNKTVCGSQYHGHSHIYTPETSHIRGFKWRVGNFDWKGWNAQWNLKKFFTHSQGMRHDVSIAINYEHWLPRDSNICLCRFNSVMVWCYENAPNQLKKEYGANWTVAMNKKLIKNV